MRANGPSQLQQRARRDACTRGVAEKCADAIIAVRKLTAADDRFRP
jgi:hypothetical protein